MQLDLDALIRVLPTAILAAAAWALNWLATGSMDAADWLPYAFLAGLLVVVVLVTGAATRPGRLELAGLATLLGLAIWEASSAAWSPVPSLARDEGLLTLLNALELVVPLVTLRTDGD